MITTGAKFYFGLGFALLLGAVLYGWTSGGVDWDLFPGALGDSRSTRLGTVLSVGRRIVLCLIGVTSARAVTVLAAGEVARGTRPAVTWSAPTSLSAPRPKSPTRRRTSRRSPQ